MKVSIDCWGTLIKGNPIFTQKKIELVKRYFPLLIDKDEFILKCFLETKKTFNDIIENSGGCQPKVIDIFTYLFSKLNGSYSRFEFISKFIQDYQNLTIVSGPILYNDETVLYLKKLSEVAELIICSNTMFIDGYSLSNRLIRLGIADFFSGMVFSDQHQIAKPNPKIYYYYSDYHIGDNILTDGIGPTNAGIKPIIINSNGKSIKDAYDIIVQR